MDVPVVRNLNGRAPMPDIGPMELIIVLVVVLLVMGPGKLPEVGAAFGKTIREFRRASQGPDDGPEPDAGTPHDGPPGSGPE